MSPGGSDSSLGLSRALRMTPNGERADAPSHADCSDQRLDRPPPPDARPISAGWRAPLRAPRSAPPTHPHAAVTLPRTSRALLSAADAANG